MPMPKRKICKFKRDQRRGHIKLGAQKLVPCAEQGGALVPLNQLRAYQEGLITVEKKS